MKKGVFIAVLVFLLFSIQYLINHLIGTWCIPNLLLILIIFVDLLLGIRYSIFTAALSGLLLDCFSLSTFGLNIYTLVVCSYFVSIIKKYIYTKGSVFSRLLLVLAVSVFNVLVQYVLFLMYGAVEFSLFVNHILIPEVVATLLVSNFTFRQLKLCALKFSVFA